MDPINRALVAFATDDAIVTGRAVCDSLQVIRFRSQGIFVEEAAKALLHGGVSMLLPMYTYLSERRV